MLRTVLMAASRSTRIRTVVENTPVTQKVTGRFVAGTTVTDAVRTARKITLDRYVSLDYLGEEARNPADARRTVTAYRTLLCQLREHGLVHRAEVSIKLSALGHALPADGAKVALDNAREVCAAAAAAGIMVTVDMEDHTTTDDTLSSVRELRADFPDTGAVLQAYLKRTEADCADLDGVGSRIRLCKGAYNEPAKVAYRRRNDIDRAYVRCLKVLMNGCGYPMVATHDPRMIDIATSLAAHVGRGTDDYEFQMLYGVRPQAQQSLARDGYRTRVYVPYGTEFFPYFMRRIGERPANVALAAHAMLRN